MCSVGDPVAAGLIVSLARPGGNITGPSAELGDLQEKLLQLLREARPNIARIALLWTPDNAASRHAREVAVAAAPRLGIAVEPIPINTPEDIDSALAAIEQHGSARRKKWASAMAMPLLLVH